MLCVNCVQLFHNLRYPSMEDPRLRGVFSVNYYCRRIASRKRLLLDTVHPCPSVDSGLDSGCLTPNVTEKREAIA